MELSRRVFSPKDGVHPIIGVAGGTGSGKTTIASAIERAVGPENLTLIPHDAYYRDRADLTATERAHLNFDHPDSLETELLIEHLDTLVHGGVAHQPVYDFREHRRKADSIELHPRRVILVEGVLVLADPELRSRMALGIYVDTDDDLRFIRRLIRDVEERGRSVNSVIEQYLETVRPMHQQFVEPSRRHADIIVPEGGYNVRAIDMICNQIRAMIGLSQGSNFDAN